MFKQIFSAQRGSKTHEYKATGNLPHSAALTFGGPGAFTSAPNSIDIVKGWTRCSVLGTLLVAAQEVDLRDPHGQELLKPLFPILDRMWLIPCHVLW